MKTSVVEFLKGCEVLISNRPQDANDFKAQAAWDADWHAAIHEMKKRFKTLGASDIPMLKELIHYRYPKAGGHGIPQNGWQHTLWITSRVTGLIGSLDFDGAESIICYAAQNAPSYDLVTNIRRNQKMFPLFKGGKVSNPNYCRSVQDSDNYYTI